MFDHSGRFLVKVAAPLLKRTIDDVGDGPGQPLSSLNGSGVAYTVSNVYPLLAIVEDENAPPGYRPLSLEDPVPGADADADAEAPRAADVPITSSLRRTHALLQSTGGWRASFRGIVPFFVYGLLYSIIGHPLAIALGPILSPFAIIIAALVTVQFSTVWVHVVLTPSSSVSWWRRLPPFASTFRAVALPTVITMLASVASVYIPALIGLAAGLPFFSPDRKPEIPSDTKTAVITVVVILSTLALQLVLTLPTLAILFRIQASLLSPDEDTIIPFDRSFGGRLEPAVVGGKPFASVRDAWASLSRPALRRIIIVFAKVYGVNFVFWLALGAFVVPQLLLGSHFSKAASGSVI
ncbi:unnamed protein product [Parascedosporium putredinis]|uniref:Uncharacterized protein n=1 Tax=Parascedosporium putredinis TaxID=1442378 RepID=A0A9P1M7J4_9PEZI|nr:unnamed protein product [Parascedosporium putredinis]CAI7987763.1 unnamed protein product [Parascedosporium putredinis]